jgi:dCTP deaminase
VILSDVEIKAALKAGQITIDPAPSEEQFTTSALDLLLGDEFREWKSPEELNREEPSGVSREMLIDPEKVKLTELLDRYAKRLALEPDGSFILRPQKFVLGVTREYVELKRRSKIAARCEGRSTLARLGLVVHLTAPTIHAGFPGKIVLEMINFGPYPLKLVPGKLAVCQLIFERLGRLPRGPVRTPYVQQRGVRA